MNRRLFALAALALAAGARAAGRCAGLSGAEHQDDHLVRPGRRLRHHRPHRRAAVAGEARPDGRGREPRRRRRSARQRGDRQFAEGRLHDRRSDRGPDHRLGDDQAGALRRGRSVRLGRTDRDRGPPDRGAAGLALQGHQVAGRSRQGGAWQDQLRQPRLRRDPASCGRTVQAGGRHQRPQVQFRSSPEALAALLSKNIDVLFDTVTALLGQVESGQVRALGVTGKDRFPAVPNVPAAVESGVVPELRRHHLVWPVRPQGHAEAGRRQAQQGAQRDARGADDPRSADQGRRPGEGSTPEAFHQFMASEYAKWGKVRQAANLEQR